MLSEILAMSHTQQVQLWHHGQYDILPTEVLQVELDGIFHTECAKRTRDQKQADTTRGNARLKGPEREGHSAFPNKSDANKMCTMNRHCRWHHVQLLVLVV